MALRGDAIRPFYHRSWIFPRDPDFAEKASLVLDLYEGRWEGEALGEGEYVISAEEKTSIQARDRRHATLSAAERRPMRVEHEEYERKGALAYLAAWAGRLGCTPGEALRSLRAQERHRALRPPCR